MRSVPRAAATQRSSRWPPARARLKWLVEEAIVDAYNESEQRCGLFTMMEDRLALPFETEVLGVPVTVERVDLTEADEVVAICRHGRNPADTHPRPAPAQPAS